METNPIDALRFYQSLDLDRFVFCEVLEMPWDETNNFLPPVSQNFASSQIVLQYILLNHGKITISLSESNFDDAVKYHFIANKNKKPIYKFECNGKVAYGRSFSEGLCKLAICLKFNIDLKKLKY